jgi:hypothetical protein
MFSGILKGAFFVVLMMTGSSISAPLTLTPPAAVGPGRGFLEELKKEITSTSTPRPKARFWYPARYAAAHSKSSIIAWSKSMHYLQYS